MVKAKIYVTLKEGVLDPQGEAVKNSLHVLGYPQVGQVRIGKYIEIGLDGQDRERAQKELAEMSDKLLANPVIEDFRVEITEG
ncbi:MAG TPA: phosphoribosylformylglycinamidine synthase subunit PurS [Syntrophomonadaceae bacterium]|nr:phosphoribosylformylglycinamidine synthase subunit PurS [Syntrophomonadaceae bacterium]